ncbi:hypothetical protein C7477_12247 [Phyllobacterium leguminum]|uniref:Uncharacterized protein n=1 Tax=Phyllobacterium leguminum TaxID=314237 RepID=A0A318T1G2_9HYPH|nr:hypothetical protein C7477_12247 [Phyllobacterium leguminum]
MSGKPQMLSGMPLTLTLSPHTGRGGHERRASFSCQARGRKRAPAMTSPSPRNSRGEGKGEGRIAPYPTGFLSSGS